VRPSGTTSLMSGVNWKSAGSKIGNGPVSAGPFYQPVSEADMDSVPTYGVVHWRIRKHRGSASEHTCGNCENQASSWAYMHDCEDELSDERGTYCPHTDHYSAMCESCHTQFDGRYGEMHKQAILTDAVVMEMRQRYATGQYSMAELGTLYGIKAVTAISAIRGIGWTHLPVLTDFKRPGRTKLTYQQAEEIRAAYAVGGVKQVDLAHRYGISQQAVSNILNNRTYTHPGTGTRRA